MKIILLNSIKHYTAFCLVYLMIIKYSVLFDEGLRNKLLKLSFVRFSLLENKGC